MSIKISLAASLFVGATLVPVCVFAAPQTVDRGPAWIADADPVRAVAVTEGDEDSATCSKSRKRLWVEGEGWVVRKVTICR